MSEREGERARGKNASNKDNKGRDGDGRRRGYVYREVREGSKMERTDNNHSSQVEMCQALVLGPMQKLASTAHGHDPASC